MLKVLIPVCCFLTLQPALASDVAGSKAATTARALVRALSEATLAAEASAKIVSLPKRDGEAFQKGETLVEFDCDRPRAEWRVAEAERIGAQAAFENSRRLSEYRATGAHEVQIARAALEKAAGAVEVINVRLRQCRIAAPFDGRVVEVPVREHELPQAGQPLLRIVDDTRLELDMIVAASSLAWLKTNATFQFTPDDHAVAFSGTVIRMGAAIDPVSQTVRVVGRIDAKPGALLPGQAGVVQFRRGGA